MSNRPDPDAIRRIACVGTGTIGAGWVAYFLSRGFDVYATDPASDAESKLRGMVGPDELKDKLIAAVDRMVGDTDMQTLEAWRDDNLLAMLDVIKRIEPD